MSGKKGVKHVAKQRYGDKIRGSDEKKIRPTLQEKALAKSAWLSGIRDDDLMNIAQCNKITLHKWKEQWRSDKHETLMNLRANNLELELNNKDIEDHVIYMDNLRSLKIQHEKELNSLGMIIDALNKIIEDLSNHPDFDSKDFKQITSMLKAYTTAKTSRSALQADYIKCCDTLNNQTGLSAFHKASGNKINEMQKAEGRLEVAMKRKEQGLETHQDLKKRGFFDVD